MLTLGKGSCPLIHDERANRIREVVWNPPRLRSDLQLVRRATLSSGVPVAHTHEWVGPPWLLMMMMHTYRMRPDGAGVYSYTLAQSILPRGRVPLIVAPRTSCISGLGRVKPT